MPMILGYTYQFGGTMKTTKNIKLKKLTGLERWPPTAAEAKELRRAHEQQMAGIEAAVAANPELQVIQAEINQDLKQRLAYLQKHPDSRVPWETGRKQLSIR